MTNLTLNPLRSPDGSLFIVGADGKSTVPIKDMGSYDLLSREVLRLKIPAGVKTVSRDDHTEVVEVYVSTPNGISNALQIPLRPKARATGGPAPTYTFVNGSLPIRLVATLSGTNGATVAVSGALPFADGTKLQVQTTDHSQPMPASITLQVSLLLNATAGISSQPIAIKNIPLVGDTYVATDAQLNLFADAVVKLMKGNSLNFGDLTSKSVTVQPDPPAGTAGPAPTSAPMNNPLKITFETLISSNSPVGVPAVAERGGSETPGGSQDKDAMARRASFGPRKSSEPEAESAQLPAEIEPVPAQIPPALGLVLPPLPGQLPTPKPAPKPIVSPVRTHLGQTTMILPQAAPTVNVTVPVTNNMPSRQRGLFHRQKPGNATPPAPRGPLLERLMGRP